MAIISPTYDPFIVYDSGKSSYWDTVTMTTGTTKVAADPGALQGSLVSVNFTRSENTGVREDLAMFDMHFAVATGVNSAWTSLNAADKAVVETQLDALWTTIKTNFPPHWILAGYTWRDFGADYPLGKTGLSKPGVVNRQTARSVAGSSGGTTVPDQVSINVSFLTASRRHWGRVYLPAPDGGRYSGFGRFTSALCDAVAGAFDTAFSALNGNALVDQVSRYVFGRLSALR